MSEPRDEEAWLRTQYEMAHHDIWWVKAQQMKVGHWTLLLLAALVAVGELIKKDWPGSSALGWVLVGLSVAVTSLGVAHVWDLYATLVRSRNRAALIVRPLKDPAFDDAKRTGKRHLSFPIAITALLLGALTLTLLHFIAAWHLSVTTATVDDQGLHQGNSLMALPTEVIAALFGAGAGAVSSVGIEWGKSVIRRRRRAKAIKVALYYEIFGHSIVPVDPAPDGQPNFVVLGFARASYDAYLDEIPDLLQEGLVGDASTYYAKVTTAASQQALIEDDITKAREVARKLGRLGMESARLPVPEDEPELLKQEARQVADRMSKVMAQNRILLSVALWQQEQLLATLRKEFKDDPSERPLNVPPKYREWARTAIEKQLSG